MFDILRITGRAAALELGREATQKTNRKFKIDRKSPATALVPENGSRRQSQQGKERPSCFM
jgi:hypothetical protein